MSLRARYERQLGRRGLWALATLLATSTACFLMAELFLRAWSAPSDLRPSFPKELIERDPRFGFRLRPDVTGRHESIEFRVEIASDSLGLRSGGPSSGGRGAFRIAVLGDSYVFGWGVESREALPEQLELALRARTGRPFDVVNMGFPARGPQEEVDHLRTLGPELSPDLVVLGFCVENDLAPRGWQGREWHESRRPPSPFELPIPFKDALIERLFVVSRAARSYHRLLVDLGLREAGSYQFDLYLAPFVTPVPDKIERAYRATKRALEDLRLALDELGSAGVVLVIPGLHQLEPYEEWSNLAADNHLVLEELIANRALPNDRVAKIGEARGFPVLDLLEVEPTPTRALHFRSDSHWNRAGHAWAAQAVARFLIRHALVPGRKVPASGLPSQQDIDRRVIRNSAMRDGVPLVDTPAFVEQAGQSDALVPVAFVSGEQEGPVVANQDHFGLLVHEGILR